MASVHSVEHVVASPVSAAATIQEETAELVRLLDAGGVAVDPVETGHVLAVALERMRPLEALEIAATVAISDRWELRAALAEALTWVFPLGCDDVVLDHLASDADDRVRLATARAAHARRSAIGGDVLERLMNDPDPGVASVAARAVMRRTV